MPGSVQCWPVLHEALSACQLSPVDCTKATHGGGGGVPVNCSAGSSKVTDSLGSVFPSFETLQLHQGVLIFCSSTVSSVGKALFLPPLSLFIQEAEYESNWLAARPRVTARADTLTPP